MEKRMNEMQKARYERQMKLDEVGWAGQERLMKSKVLIVGTGGLGSPVALYLAAAGVGTIGLIDSDVVEISNLQRQIIHTVADIGKPKVESAYEKIHAQNPDVEVRRYAVRLSEENVDDLLADYDFIIEASDNFATKYLVNDACVRLRKPLAIGSVFRYSGQLMTILPDTAQLRDLFPEQPDADEVDCSRFGLLATLPGIVGSMLATEALKYILGVGQLLTNQFFTIDTQYLLAEKFSA